MALRFFRTNLRAARFEVQKKNKGFLTKMFKEMSGRKRPRKSGSRDKRQYGVFWNR